jgi:hypothetical protein
MGTKMAKRRERQLKRYLHDYGWHGLVDRERALVAALSNVISLYEAQEEQSDEPEDQAILFHAQRLCEKRSRNLFEPIKVKAK